MSAHTPITGGDRLDAVTRQEITSRLQALAHQLEENMAAQRERLSAVGAATSNTFIAGSEGAMASAEDDDAMALLRHDEAELKRVREALARLAEADFGHCSDCGEWIGCERLLVVPQAQLCVACQTDAERQHRVRAAQVG